MYLPVMGTLPCAICIAGPTGTGKSAAALRLAEALNGEIVNADSRQVYADFPVITAQPGPEERAARPHHLYGFLEITEKITAGQWLMQARIAMDAVRARGSLPILVGGTGMYIRGLTRGMAEIPPLAPELVQRLEREYAELGAEALHARLREADPDYAARTPARNRQRLLRALAVWEGTGKSFSAWHAEAGQQPFCRVLCLTLRADLAGLTPRLEQRITAMLEAGALDEARSALARCADPVAPGWTGIGCAELYRHLTGELSLEQARLLWLRNTRSYAKRQLTWFRGQADCIWMDAEDHAGMLERAHNFLR